ncbi:MAG: aldo/keto reductase [archaeon]
MKFRKLGPFDWDVSVLGFGCMRLPSLRINRLRADTKKSVELIRYGIDKGINYVDTAWSYHLGDREKVLGKALKDGYRERVFWFRSCLRLWLEKLIVLTNICSLR